MNDLFEKAGKLLSDWKGDRYIFGRSVLPRIGGLASRFGKKFLLVCDVQMNDLAGRLAGYLKNSDLEITGAIVPGAGPNAPRADVYRIETYILHYKPDLIIAAGGGSTIDAAKAADFLSVLGGSISPEIDHWFGTGIVSGALQKTGKKLIPLIAVQTSASSGAHLTRYSNITDPAAGQKKLIVDEGIVPQASLFDYDLSATMPLPVTIDGILDSMAHCFEVFSGLPANTPGEKYDLAASITETAAELVIQYAPRVIKDPQNPEAREAMGLATDLGAYAIMVGGTHGPHMNSFSLVDIAGHGTACGIMNPYYAVFFAPAIERQLRLLGSIYKKHGFISENPDTLSGRDLGITIGRAMVAFGKAIGAPTALRDLKRWDDIYIDKILEAARDPQLEMKLKNMPIPLSASEIDEYMGPIIRSALDGDFSLIKSH